jgi:hypothetical protein
MVAMKDLQKVVTMLRRAGKSYFNGRHGLAMCLTV